MTAPAAWYPDPTGTHEVRYWDGAAWTAHVADRGVAAAAALPPGAALPPPAVAPPAVPTAPAGEPAWKDLLEKVGESGKSLAEKARQAVAEAADEDPRPAVGAAQAAPAAAPSAVPAAAVPATAVPAAAAPTAAPAAAAVDADDDAPDVSALAKQLRELGKLRKEGLLTDAEFEVQKARLLDG